MNQLATQQHGTALAHPPINYFQAYGEQMGQRSITGRLLKFSKGDFLVGENNEEVEEGTQLIANMDELMVGWIRWHGGKPTDHVMGRVSEGYQAQRRDQLGDNDEAQWEVDENGQLRDPWQFSNYLVLKDPEGRGEDALFTFTTSSRGGINAIGDLCVTYGKQMRQHEDEFPIIALKTGSYQHSNKAYGRIKFPILEVVGWASKNALIEEVGKVPEKTAPTLKKGKGRGRDDADILF